MAQLGQKERITYTAKNLRSGLDDLTAYVIKPNGAKVGPFEVLEYADSNFRGFYFFDFHTNKSIDDFGTYTGVIVSPTEIHRAPFKIVYDEISVGELNDIVDSVTDAIKMLSKVDLEVTVEDNQEIELTVND